MTPERVTLTEAELDSLTECECGHFANEHSSDGCLATDFSEDWRPIRDGDRCACSHSPTAINRHGIEAIVAARVAAARAAIVTALVDDERARQVRRWGLRHDREHGTRTLNLAASAYEQESLSTWPWAQSQFKPRTRWQNLIRAAALYQAAADARVYLSEGNEVADAYDGRRRCEAALVADLGGEG